MLRRPAVTAATLRHVASGPTAGRDRRREDRSLAFRMPKAAEIVADHIRNMIIRGDLAPGDYLQPEAQLIEQFSTSRATIREAVMILEAEQFLSVKRGSRDGAQVRVPDSAHTAKYAGFVLQAQGTTVADIYLVRAAIEPYAVWLLASRHRCEDVEVLRAELARAQALQDSDDVESLRVALARFHRSLVDLTGSNSLRLVIATFQDVIERHQRRLAALATPRDECMGLKSFWKLIDLIERGEAERAQSHWRMHIQTTLDDWLSQCGDASMVDLLD
jgi:DNA-binding FadR family transcriptional regulator